VNKPQSASLTGWILRDLGMLIVFNVIVTVLALLQHAYPGLAIQIVSAISGFFIAYATCYVFHEWGHLIGARLSGAAPPLGSYRGVLLAMFDPAVHSRRQFVFLSYGGVAGYLLAASLLVLMGLLLRMPGLFVGGLAFVVQSLAVDLPIIFKVQQGADITTTASAGAHPRVILKRTGQTWSLLALAIIVWTVAT
jgi:hypothetical protein